MHHSHTFVALLFALFLIACNTENQPGAETDSTHTTSAVIKDSVVQIAEAWLTDRSEADNVDSPAPWHGPNGEHWVIATAKETNQLIVYDANTGKTIRKIGKEGTEAGEFNRPNGITVIDNLVLVVERDNHRIQVLQLPDFQSLGFIGAEHLKNRMD